MKKRRILAAAALAAAIVGLALLLLYSSLDSLVETAIETYGSEVLGTRVRVSSVELTLSEGRTTSNIDAILANVRAHPGGGGASASGGGERDEPPRITIGSFVFEEGRVDADLEAVGGETVTAELPPVRLKKIGGSRGATPDEIGKQVMSAFLGSVTRSVARSRIERVIDEKLGGAGDAAKKLLQRVLD